MSNLPPTAKTTLKRLPQRGSFERDTVNAILDATWDLGVRDLEMPATPHKVWTAIQNAKLRS